MASKSKVRLQIHVDAELAERIDSLAKRMNRSLAWMVAELLIQAIVSRERFIDWMAWRVVKLVGCADPRNLVDTFKRASARPLHKGTVYLQTQVSPEVVANLDKLAEANQRSRADMGTLLLNWTMDDEEWLLQAVTSRWFAAMYDGLNLPRGQQSCDNGEENRRREGTGEPEREEVAGMEGGLAAA